MIEKIVRENREITLIGTGHVFKESVKEVEETILFEEPEAVCVELDPKRYYGLLTGQRMDFIDIVRVKGIRVGVVAGLLQYLERKIGEQMGVFPGKEMITATQISAKVDAKLYFIDRDAEVTIERMTKMPFREKFSLLKNFFLSFFRKETVTLDLTKDNIDLLTKELERISPHLYKTLIDERDQLMAEKLKALKEKSLVAVVGAGHLRGILERITF
ncbi:MAG: TraB/GumN family protein [Euryarchaeota archaeon]|nr:TraB/GumN family protein [Euryarchaeota archaeon]